MDHSKEINELISVIIPTYNRAGTLERAAKSVLNQSHKQLELIIVDDGSSDNTKNVVEMLDDNRITYLKHEKQLGGSAARNTGIKNAHGLYIAFQDSDDEWLPTKLEKQYSALKNSSDAVGVVFTSFWRVKENGQKILLPDPSHKHTEGDIHTELLEDNLVTTQSSMVKVECFKKAGLFDEDLPAMHEWDLWIRISKFYEFLHIKEPLVRAYATPGNLTSQSKKRLRAKKMIFDKNRKELERFPKLLHRHALQLGNAYALSHNIKEARPLLMLAWKTKPYSMGTLIRVLLAYIGSGGVYILAARIRKQQ